MYRSRRNERVVRALSAMSLVFAGTTVALAFLGGPAFLTGSLSLFAVSTAGVLKDDSRSAPAVFLLSCSLLLVAVVVHVAIAR